MLLPLLIEGIIIIIIVIIIKVSGLKASIDAALGRIFEIDGQNAEEEARLLLAMSLY